RERAARGGVELPLEHECEPALRGPGRPGPSAAGWRGVTLSGRRRETGRACGGPRVNDHGQPVLGTDGGHLADLEMEVLGQGEGEAGEDAGGDGAHLQLAG